MYACTDDMYARFKYGKIYVMCKYHPFPFCYLTPPQVCHGSKRWETCGPEEDAERLPESHLVQESLQRTQDVVLFQP